MSVFVTVGTTSFDELIEVVNDPIFHAILCHLGYEKLSVQFGNGSIEPCSFDESQICQALRNLPFEIGSSPPPRMSLELHSFRYKDNLDACFSDSQLVISHGGAGSCMEALTPPGKRKLIIVVNENLMHNHQEELALSFLEGRYAFVTKTSDLLSFMSTGNQSTSYKTGTVLPYTPTLLVDEKPILLTDSSTDSTLRDETLQERERRRHRFPAPSIALSTLIGPISSPKEAGLLPFHRGDRSALMNFINETLNVD